MVVVCSLWGEGEREAASQGRGHPWVPSGGGGGEGGSKPGKGALVGPLWGEGRGRQQTREGGTREGEGERGAASQGRGRP